MNSTELGGNVDNRERVSALGRYSKALAGARLPQRGGAGPEASPAGPGPRLTPARRPWAQHADPAERLRIRHSPFM